MKINQYMAERTAATNSRRTIAIAAGAPVLTIGTIYSWGIFTQPLLAASVLRPRSVGLLASLALPRIRIYQRLASTQRTSHTANLALGKPRPLSM